MRAKNAAPPIGKKPWARRYFSCYWQLYAMMLLPFCYFILFKYVPMFGNILAFRRFKPLTGPYGVSWVGLRYFNQFLNQPDFWRAFRNTLTLSVINLVVNFPIPILFAILLNEVRNLKFKKLVQTVSYMPRFISTVVVISILTELLSPSSGLINRMLKSLFGMEPVYFMNDARYFRIIYVLTDTWQYTGWTAIIYLAAITGISQDMFEAARIDGANRVQQIWYVTLPSILPTIMVLFILNVGRLLSLGFEKVLLMYTPANSQVSDIIDTYVYRMGFQSSANQYSYATAIGLFSGIIGLILVSSSNYCSRRFTGDSIY